MFGVTSKQVAQKSSTPEGVEEIVFCVFDDKFRNRHYFRSGRTDTPSADCLQFLNDAKQLFESYMLREAIQLHEPASLSLSFGIDRRKYLYVLPYDVKRGKWRYACLQILTEVPEADAVGTNNLCCPLAEDRVVLLLVDARNTIHSASVKVPKVFGYAAHNLVGMSLSDLFSNVDMNAIASSPSDTNESILNCAFKSLDGSRRDVEIKKYEAPDRFVLYAVCDVTPPQYTEEISQISTRERRRIGQDLHDSIGQVLTGISLLSRSLANNLKRIGSSGDADAAQISALADDASNQIRQISRGLIISEIVTKGLFDSLRELARTTSRSCGLPCVTHIDETVGFTDGAIETHLYRIAQEAVNNAVRHAGASKIEINLYRLNGTPRMEIVDDGIWKGEKSNVDGIGIKTMGYRAAAIGARLRVGADPQGGTRVVCMMETDEQVETKA